MKQNKTILDEAKLRIFVNSNPTLSINRKEMKIEDLEFQKRKNNIDISKNINK